MNVNRKIFNSALVIGAITVIVKLAAAARDLVTAAFFGTSHAVDSFFLALTISSVFVNILAASFGSATIPLYLRSRANSDPDSSKELLSSCLNLLLLILTVGSAALYLFFLAYFRIKHPGALSKEAMLTRALIEILLPTIIFSGLSSYVCSILNAIDEFGFPAASGLVIHLSGAAGILVFHESWQIYSLAIGILFGSIAQFAFLWRRLSSRRLVSPLIWKLDSSVRAELRARYVPMALASLLMGSTPIIDQVMASWLGPGEVAILGYGNKVAGFFLDVGALALGTAIFPYLARMSASNDARSLVHTIRVYTVLILATTLPLAIILSLGSHPLVRLVFERGSFSAADSSRVARIQAILAFQMPFYALGTLYTRVLPAIGANTYILWGTCISLVLNFTLNYILMNFMGLEGIALSTVLVYAVAATFTGFVSYKQLKPLLPSS